MASADLTTLPPKEQHRAVLALCFSQTLCRECQRGMVSRQKALRGRCPNPACKASPKGPRLLVARIVRQRDAYLRPLSVDLRPVRQQVDVFRRLQFCLGGVVISHMPNEGRFWTWLKESH